MKGSRNPETSDPGWTSTPPGSAPGWSSATPGSAPGWSSATPGSGPGWSSATPGSGPGWSSATPGSGPGWSSATLGSALGWSSATPRSLLSEAWEKLHIQTDPLLTAARLVRGGWGEDREKTGRQFSYFISVHQPTFSGLDRKQGPNRAEICLKEPGRGRVPVVNGTSTPGKETEEARQKAEGAERLSANGKMDLWSKAGVVYVLASGCRSTCRQSRRFKAPTLPVIAEI